MIYVAHAYGNLASNKRSVELIIKELALRNPELTYISPIHTFGFLYTTVDYEKGMDYCFELLMACRSAIFCHGWETSKGCVIEMGWCRSYGIPFKILGKEDQ